jgi:hypothetical protein
VDAKSDAGQDAESTARPVHRCRAAFFKEAFTIANQIDIQNLNAYSAVDVVAVDRHVEGLPLGKLLQTETRVIDSPETRFQGVDARTHIDVLFVSGDVGGELTVDPDGVVREGRLRLAIDNNTPSADAAKATTLATSLA